MDVLKYLQANRETMINVLEYKAYDNEFRFCDLGINVLSHIYRLKGKRNYWLSDGHLHISAPLIECFGKYTMMFTNGNECSFVVTNDKIINQMSFDQADIAADRVINMYMNNEPGMTKKDAIKMYPIIVKGLIKGVLKAEAHRFSVILN